MSRRPRGDDRFHGVVVIDKPAGVTSAVVVRDVRRALGARRVGHTGTLDPMATGVLPVCLGEGTKLATFLLAEDKAYEGELELGVETDTLDADGAVSRRDPEAACRVTEDQLRAALAARVGGAEQLPPMYSSVKHRGRRLHELARAGVEVERQPRRVRIDRFELLGYDPPRARFVVECSKGTYVRTLVADLGTTLGCGAHLTALRRTRSGPFDIEQSVQPHEITNETVGRQLIGPARAAGHLPGVRVPEPRLAAVANGQRLPWRAVGGDDSSPRGRFRLLTPDGELVAIAEISGGRLRYERVFRYWQGA